MSETIPTAISQRFRPYSEYRPSDGAWLGQVPKQWSTRRLKSAIQIAINGVWGEESQNDENDIICIRVADFDYDRLGVSEDKLTIRNVTISRQSRRLLLEGDLLIEKSGGGEKQTVGRVVSNTLEQNAVCSNFIARMAIDPEVNSRFLCYVFFAAYAQGINVASIKQTTGIQNLDLGSYLSEVWTVPSKREQERIAAFLDHHTAVLDNLINEKQKLIDLLKEKRIALISHAVTKGLNPDAPMKDSGVPWIGQIPSHWEIRELRRIIRSGSSITYGIVQAGPHVEDGIPYIRTSDMSNDEFSREGYLRTSVEIDHKYRRSRVEAGDLVIAIRATVGKTLQVPECLNGANLTQGTAKIAPNETVDNSFLLWTLNSINSQQRFQALGKGATFKEITLDMLRRFVVPFPLPLEQEAISEHLAMKTSKVNNLIDEIENGIMWLEEYRTSLISAAVTGKIDVRGFTTWDSIRHGEQ